jgi:pimeloyl-ACP methyl ester carboxylesterase
MTKIKVDMDPSLEAYRMMYWSDGIKSEAYVAVPKGPGTYSISIECHGGWTIPRNKSHVSFIALGHGTIPNKSPAQALLKQANKYRITLAPMYRGYGNSNGTVHGIYENTIDTKNAIKAVTAYFKENEKTRHIQKRLYLYGISMGGAVALKTAAERNDVRQVEAVSPFVGWNIFDQWAKNHMAYDRWSDFYYASVAAYGPFDPESPVYQRQSIPYKKMKAPHCFCLVQPTRCCRGKPPESFIKK